MAATPASTLLESGKCYACYGASFVDTIELALWDLISQNTSSDPYDGLLVYTRQGLGTTTVVNPVGAYNLTFGANRVTEIHCHNCPLITSLTCDSSNVLTVVDLENCATLDTIRFQGATALVSVDLSTFIDVAIRLDFRGCTSLTLVDLSNLQTVGWIDFGLTAMAAINLPLLATASYLGGDSITVPNTFSAPQLTTVDGFIQFGGNSGLTSFSAPLLQQFTAGQMLFNGCASLLSISLPSLSVAGGSIIAGGCSSLSVVALPLLQNVAGNINFPDAVSLVSVDLGSLQISDYIVFDQCPLLAAISLSSYAIPVQGLSADSCSSLVTVGFNGSPISDGGEILMPGCALSQASVDLVLAAGVAGGMTGGAIDLGGGTSSAPSAAGLVDAGILTTAGVSVTTN